MADQQKNTAVFFLPSLEGGGAERGTVNLVNGLEKEKYRIILLLARKKGPFLKYVEQHVTVVDLNASFPPLLLVRMIRYVSSQTAIDIFVSMFPRFNVISMLAAFFSGRRYKVVIIEHSTLSRLFITAKKKSHAFAAYFFLPFLVRFFYPQAKAIVCVSEAVKKDLMEYNASLENVRVIYNPVVEETITGLSEKPVDHPWFYDKTIPVLVAVGRLVAAKDYPTLLEALALVAGKIPVRLVILGEGDLEGDLKKAAKELGIQEHVDFLGWRENPYAYVSRGSLFVSASLREGFSNVIIEAMAVGTPVVSTDCAGPKEIITDGKNGLLVPVGDKVALAKALLRVLQDSSLARQLSGEGKTRAMDFTVKKSIENYEHLFAELF